MQSEPLALEAELLKVLGHPARLRIVQLLAGGETCVCDLIPAVGLEQSNLSQHLKLMRKNGILETRRDGSRVLYRLANPAVLPVLAAAEDAVRRHLERMVALASARSGE